MFTCTVAWGDQPDQQCTRHEDHGGVHIDALGREWGWVSKGGW